MLTLRTGLRVHALVPIDYCTAIIAKGERGVVVWDNLDATSVQWDTLHAGLNEWDNCTDLVEEDRDALGKAPWRPRLPETLTVCTMSCSLAVGALIGFAGVPATTVTASMEPPIKLVSARAEPSLIRIGDPLTLRIVATYLRVCDTTIDKAVVTYPEQTTVWRERKWGVGQAVTAYPIERLVVTPLPPGLPPGKYLYRVIVNADCGPTDHHHFAQPDVPFELVD